MSLIVGEALDPKLFFSEGKPKIRRSSFELTIGTIYDHKGNVLTGHFELEPNHMVQVVSAEVFDLPNTVTGHLAFKATLSRKGVWALTTGLVDPGWNGPISTTLVNFANTKLVIQPGDVFMRVSLFEHAPVIVVDAKDKIESTEVYMRGVQDTAINTLKETFLNQEELARKASKDASEKIMEGINSKAIVWLSIIVGVFTLITLIPQIMDRAWPKNDDAAKADREISRLHDQVDTLEKRLYRMRLDADAARPTPQSPQQPPARPSH
jgi:dUTPase